MIDGKALCIKKFRYEFNDWGFIPDTWYDYEIHYIGTTDLVENAKTTFIKYIVIKSHGKDTYTMTLSDFNDKFKTQEEVRSENIDLLLNN